MECPAYFFLMGCFGTDDVGFGIAGIFRGEIVVVGEILLGRGTFGDGVVDCVFFSCTSIWRGIGK